MGLGQIKWSELIEGMFLSYVNNTQQKQWNKQRSMHKKRPFPYNYFVSPPETKGMQPNASAVIVCRQLKPSITQQESGGKVKYSQAKGSGGAGGKAKRRIDSTWPFGDWELGGV